MRSSISSSELPLFDWPARRHSPRASYWASAIRGRVASAALGCRARVRGQRWPWGLLLALVIIIAAQILATLWHPEPVAHPKMRRKVLDLTVSRRPSVVICGDSRLLALRPSLVGEGLGLLAGEVINASVVGSHSDAALAVVREFQGRFAPRPVLLVSVLMTQVDEWSDWWEPEEYLWQAPLRERWRLGGFRNVVTPVFLPERALWNDLVELVRPARHWDDDGYHAPGPDDNLARQGPARLANQVNAFVRDELSEVEIEGPRWQRLQAVIEELGRSPVQLVVVNAPMYPGVERALTPQALANCELFRQNMAALCARCQVPLLFYDAHGHDGGDGAELYSDMLHLNAAGAEVWSKQVGEDLRRLMEQGRITLPASASRDGGGHAHCRGRG